MFFNKSNTDNKKIKKKNKSELIKVAYNWGSFVENRYIKLSGSFNVIWKKIVENCPFKQLTNNLQISWIGKSSVL